MPTIRKSFTAGFIATTVLSLLMLMKQSMGVMPNLNPISMINEMAGHVAHMQLPLAFGWLMHYVIGTFILGGLYYILVKKLPGKKPFIKGSLFSIIPWLVMMLFIMPLDGKGIFGLAAGNGVLVMTLIMHIMWGAVLGTAYGFLQKRK